MAEAKFTITKKGENDMGNFLKRTLFGGLAEVIITTRDFGPFKILGDELSHQLSELKEYCNKEEIFFLEHGQETPLLNLNKSSPEDLDVYIDLKDNELEGFRTSFTPSQAVVSSELPLAALTQDSPTAIFLLEDKEGKQSLGIEPLPLEALLFEKSESRLSTTVQAMMAENFKILEAWIGFGASSCCAALGGSSPKWPFVRRWQVERLEASKGPMQGLSSLELTTMAKRQLVELGLNEEKISTDLYCTCCSGGKNPETDGLHFSKILGNSNFETHVVMAYLK